MTQALLSAIVESSDDAIISKNLEGIITSWNKGAERIFGYTEAEAVGKSVTMLIPPERQSEEPVILAQLRRGERVDHFETVRVGKNGELIDISLTISPVKDEAGNVVGASKIARDITERKRTEEALRALQQRYALALEERIEHTTSQLSESQERLRIAERMASLGTLSAGLGHDIGNVLMPLRANIEVIASHVGQSNGLRDNFQSIRKSVEYLQTLASGLRMLAVDPERQDGSPNAVNLDQWWQQNLPLLKTTLGRHISLEHDIPADLPPVAIANHLLTQAVFNLIQNASQALAGPPIIKNAQVRVSAARHGDRVRISVSDNGPGMSPEVKARCVEPYFTTKTRGISTGLGLTLVHGIVQAAKGSLEIETGPGRGCLFMIDLPIACQLEQCVSTFTNVRDDRQGALIRHLLQGPPFVRVLAPEQAQVIVTDTLSDAEEMLRRNGEARCLLLGSEEASLPPEIADRITFMKRNATSSHIRNELQCLARRVSDKVLS